MSANGIDSVLARASRDPDFADLLFLDTDRALAGYDLTAEEAALFRNSAYADYRATTAWPRGDWAKLPSFR